MIKKEHHIGAASDFIENETRTVVLDDGSDVAILLHQDNFHAFGSLCPHQNASLDGAPAENGQVICQRHGYRFSLKTGDCRTVGGYGIPLFETQVRDGEVYVLLWDFGSSG